MRWISNFLLAIGFALLAVFLAAYLHRMVMVRVGMRSFEDARRQAAASATDSQIKETGAEEGVPGSPAENTRSPGSEGQGSPAASARRSWAVPLAILRIPRIHLNVPVLGSTDDITLNRGVGRIAGTAAPGQKGNIGIAGHRDSFFQDLKEVNRGDEIEIETTTTSEVYVVDRILVTGEDDLSVLQTRDSQSLTLITCYPFHYVGPAPRRFVVQATIKGTAISSSQNK
ncbi:MAG TPA: class D sortase [Ktedonobacteraceae bacterium]|nr:class D sortase [Ktedonobacteraceae bacterium]